MEIFSFPLDTDLELVQYTLNNVRDVWILLLLLLLLVYIYIYIYIYEENNMHVQLCTNYLVCIVYQSMHTAFV